MESIVLAVPPPRAGIFSCLIVFVVLLLSAATGSALITVGHGNEPVGDNNWPAGAVDVANLKTRVGYWEGPPLGGGQLNFLYRGATADFQAALELFARIKAPELRLVVHEGPHESPFLRNDQDEKVETRVDWSFTVWNPASWHRLYNNPKSTFAAGDPSGGFRSAVEPPRIDVYVGGGAGIEWARVKVPKNVRVTDERASSAGYAAGTGSVVRGDVYDMVTSKPVAGVRIRVARYDDKLGKYEDVALGQADADGQFEVTKIPPGTHLVEASADGYAPRVLGDDAFGSDTLKEFTVYLATAARVTATVTDIAGKPVAGVIVRADDIMGPDGGGYPLATSVEAKTDADGHVELTGLPRGYCRPYAHAKGYAMLNVLEVHPVPSERISLRVTATGTVSGKVTRIGGGALDADYVISIEPEGGLRIGSWGGSGQVKPDGTFSFENVPPGRYTVSARPNPGPAMEGDDPNAKTIEVKARHVAEVAFEVPGTADDKAL